MSSAVQDQIASQPETTETEGSELEDAAAGITSWIHHWQTEESPETPRTGGEVASSRAPLPPIPSANLSPEREAALKVVREAGEGGVATLLDSITAVLEDKESIKKEAEKRKTEVKDLKAQLELAQTQLAEAKKANQRLGLDKPRSRPLSSHSRASTGQRPRSQTEISTHSLLGRCLSSVSQRSMESRLESSLDDIDDAIKIIQDNVGNPDKAVRSLLNTTRDQVKFALSELQAIVTHDDNLERQYNEAVVTNSQLERDLDRTRNEMRHLKGKLSISELTPFAVRKERARLREAAASRRKITQDMQRSRAKTEAQLAPLQTARERSRTVNAKGQYMSTKHGHHSSSRQQTSDQSPTRPGHRRSISEPLPPPLVGCRCSVCRSVQSLGATTASHLRGNMTARSGQRDHIQQIVLGDCITLKGGRKGIVRYIGRLHSEVAGLTIFIGVQLSEPVGRHHGTLDGRRYFSCPPKTGLFVTVSDVLDVGGKAIGRGASLPASRAPGSTRTTIPVSHQHHTTGDHLQLRSNRQQEQSGRKLPSTVAKLPSISNRDTSLTVSKVESRGQAVSRETQRTQQSKQSSTTVATSKSRPTPVASETAPETSSREVQTVEVDERSTARKHSGVSEADIDNLSQRLSALLDSGRREEGRIRASQVMKAGVDYYAVEEFLREIFLLADDNHSGLISPEDFLNLLQSQALLLQLSETEQELLLSKVKHMQDGKIPYAATVPHLGIMLQEVKVETRTPPSARDWCNFFSQAVNEVVFWNVRTGDVTCDAPDNVNMDELRQVMSTDLLDVEMEVLKFLLKAMEEKDVGGSGFLTPREFTDVLLSDACPIKLTPAEAEQVLFHCGSDLTVDMGIPYLNHIPVIRNFISQVQSFGEETAAHDEDDNNHGWTLAYFNPIGVFYHHKLNGQVQYSRPPHCLPDDIDVAN